MGESIAITGASGLLGANLVLELAGRGHAVTALYGSHPIAVEAVRSVACDAMDGETMARELRGSGASLVIHCAAAAGVDWCEAHPGECMRMNAEAAGLAAGHARAVGAGFVFISTDAVFDGAVGGYRETDAIAPGNWYARGKAAGEAAVLRAVPDALVLRVNIYGWNMQGKHSLAEWMLSQLERGMAVPGFVDTTFAPVLANDVAEWILALHERRAGGIWHAASRDHCSKYEFARGVAQVFGLDADLVRESRLASPALSAPRPRHTWLCADRLAAALGKPMPSVIEGLVRFRALRDNGFVSRLKAAGGPHQDAMARHSNG